MSEDNAVNEAADRRRHVNIAAVVNIGRSSSASVRTRQRVVQRDGNTVVEHDVLSETRTSTEGETDA